MKKRTLKQVLALVFASLMVFTLAACGQSGDSSASSSGAATSSSQQGGGQMASEGQDVQGADEATRPTEIQAGTTFSYWLNYDIPSFMPWMDNRGTALMLQVYDNLLYKHNANGEDIRGNLAESWEVSDDGLVWVFQIKQDAFFTSGNQVNAEAFVKSWDAAKDFQPRMFAPVESYEATGEFELTVTLHSPSATFIYDLPLQSLTGVVDPELLEQYGAEDNRAAVGSGPYYIEKYTSGEGFVLKANPNYHNPDRQPCIETINMVIIPDENTAVIALMNDELDSMNTVNVEVYNNLVDAGWNVSIVTDRQNPYWFNLREVELFRDPVVREALCHMIDWQAVSDLVYDGMFPDPQSLWVGPGEYAYDEGYTYDPELGIQMLEDAGYSKDDIKFTMLADPDFTDQEVAIMGQFQELGFNNIDTVTYDGATCYGMLKGGTYEMFPVHNGYGVESPLTTYSMGLTPEGTQRVMWLDYADEDRYAEAMEYYETARTAPDWDTYLENVTKISQIMVEENLFMGGLLTMRMYGIAPRFGGVYIAPITGYFDFCYLWDVEAASA